MDPTVLLAAIGAIIGVAALMLLAYKGVSTIIYSTIAVILVCIFSRINLIDGIFNVFAMETGKYLGQYLFLFATGAIFTRTPEPPPASPTPSAEFSAKTPSFLSSWPLPSWVWPVSAVLS